MRKMEPWYPKQMNNPGHGVSAALSITTLVPRLRCCSFFVRNQVRQRIKTVNRFDSVCQVRAGQLDEAVESLQKSLEIDPVWEARFLNWFGLALAHHRRGEAEEARCWFERAVELMQRHPGPTTQDRLEAQLLRRELEQLLATPDK
jgi:tetratricopeptide (TPR) repeat protein